MDVPFRRLVERRGVYLNYTLVFLSLVPLADEVDASRRIAAELDSLGDTSIEAG